MKQFAQFLIALLIIILFSSQVSLVAQEKKYYSKGSTTISYEPSAECDGRPVRFTIEWTLTSYLGEPAYNVKVKAEVYGTYAYYNGKRYNFESENSSILSKINPQLSDWSVKISASLGDYDIDLQENSGITGIRIDGLSSKEISNMLKSGNKLHSFNIGECIDFNTVDFAREVKKKQEILKSKQQTSEESTNNTTQNNTVNSTSESNTQNNNSTFQPQIPNLNKVKSVEYTNKANLFYANGSYDEAEMYWGKAVELDPSNQAAKNNLANLKNAKNSNAQIMAQSQERANNFNTQQQNIQQSSEQIANNLVDGSPNAIGQAGVATAKLLAENGASFTESMAGGAGVVAVGALLKSNKEVNYENTIELEDGIFKGKTIDNWPKEGRFEFNNGDVFEGKFLVWNGPSAHLRRKMKVRPWVYKGTMWFANGNKFDGTFNQQGPGNKTYYPYNGTMTYKDGSIYRGEYFLPAKGARRWKRGTYTSPDKQLAISGMFDNNKRLTSGFYSYRYQSGSGNIIKLAYPNLDEITLTFANKHVLLVNFSSADSFSNLKIIYRKKEYGGKKVKLTPTNIDETVKTIAKLGGVDNLSYIYSYLSRVTADSTLKEKFYSTAIKLTTSLKQKQCIEFDNNNLISLNLLFNKWQWYARTLHWNFENIEESKNDAWFIHFEVRQHLIKGDSLIAKQHLNKAIKYCKNDKRKAEIYNSIGGYHYNKKDYKKANEYFLKSLQLNSQNFSVIRGIGNSYLLMKDFTKSISYLEKACELNPNLGDGYYLAIANLCAGNIKTSKKIFAKYCNIYKKDKTEEIIGHLNGIKGQGYDDNAIEDIIENILH